jgi:hypothetical protein
MILYTSNGLTIYEVRSDKPDSDWTGKAEHIIDELDPSKAELIRKIKMLAPFVTLVVEGDDVIDAMDDAEARAAWQDDHPVPQPEPSAPTADAVTWDVLAEAYKEGVNSIDE